MQLLLADNLSKSFRDYFNALAGRRSDVEILPANIGLFRSTEPFSDPKGNPADQDVVLLQSLSGNVSEECMKMLLTVAALKRKGAKSVTAAMPYAPFGRQDKAPLLAGNDFPMLLKAAGTDKIVTAEVHSKRAEQFYTDHFGAENVTFLSNAALFADHIRATHRDGLDRLVLGAPDGSDKPEDAAQIHAREITRLVFGLPALSDGDRAEKMFGIKKLRRAAGVAQVDGFTGNVSGRLAITIDDMSDTGGTVMNACEAQLTRGALGTSVYLSHGLFDGEVLDKILSARFNGRALVGQLTVSDSVPGIEEKLNARSAKHPDETGRFNVVSNAPQFAAALGL